MMTESTTINGNHSTLTLSALDLSTRPAPAIYSSPMHHVVELTEDEIDKLVATEEQMEEEERQAMDVQEQEVSVNVDCDRQDGADKEELEMVDDKSELRILVESLEQEARRKNQTADKPSNLDQPHPPPNSSESSHNFGSLSEFDRLTANSTLLPPSFQMGNPSMYHSDKMRYQPPPGAFLYPPKGHAQQLHNFHPKFRLPENFLPPGFHGHLGAHREPPHSNYSLVDQTLVCPECHKSFRFEKNFLRHMEKAHAAVESESVLKCKLCNYTTKHYSNMYVHIRTHTGDKPYFCAACGANFTQGSSLKLHIKSRHGDKPGYFCLSKKPCKNSLTKLWTRVLKKDIARINAASRHFGPYFGPHFSSPHHPFSAERFPVTSFPGQMSPVSPYNGRLPPLGARYPPNLPVNRRGFVEPTSPSFMTDPAFHPGRSSLPHHPLMSQRNGKAMPRSSSMFPFFMPPNNNFRGEERHPQSDEFGHHQRDRSADPHSLIHGDQAFHENDKTASSQTAVAISEELTSIQSRLCTLLDTLNTRNPRLLHNSDPRLRQQLAELLTNTHTPLPTTSEDTDTEAHGNSFSPSPTTSSTPPPPDDSADIDLRDQSLPLDSSLMDDRFVPAVTEPATSFTSVLETNGSSTKPIIV